MPFANTRRRAKKQSERGLGLLEMISSSEEPDSTLPPGQRDAGGFWYPSGYVDPGDIFTPAQRKLQAKQRQVQRHRLDRPSSAPATVSIECDAISDLADRPMPLPAPASELRVDDMPPGWAQAGPAARSAAAAPRRRLTEADLACVVTARPVVDSRKGSD